MNQIKKLFVVLVALSVAILGGCTVKPGSADDGLTMTGSQASGDTTSGALDDSVADDLPIDDPELQVIKGIEVMTEFENSLHSGGYNYKYNNHKMFIGYTDNGQDIVGNIKTLYGFDQIDQDQVVLDTGYVYFVADAVQYRYDFDQQAIYLAGDDEGYTEAYHTSNATITEAELDSGTSYLISGPKMIGDQQVTQISVMWENRPVNSFVPVDYASTESIEWTFDLAIDARMIKTGANQYVVVYSPDTGSTIGVDGFRVIYELVE